MCCLCSYSMPSVLGVLACVQQCASHIQPLRPMHAQELFSPAPRLWLRPQRPNL